MLDDSGGVAAYDAVIRDIFGVVNEDGLRQFRTVYIEIGKKNGKSELAAAIALYLLYADNEPAAEVFSAAADRQQGSIVFEVGRRMIEMTPALNKRSKILVAGKRVVHELVADEATMQNTGNKLLLIMPRGIAREKMLREYEMVNQKLGGAGASQKAAKMMVELLRNE